MNLKVMLCKGIVNYNDQITIAGQFQIADVDMEMTFNRFVDSYEKELKNIESKLNALAFDKKELEAQFHNPDLTPENINKLSEALQKIIDEIANFNQLKLF